MTLQPPPPPTHTNSKSAISQLLLTRFWWNLKGRLQGTSRADSNCHSDICPGNICLGHICPYQEYLRSQVFLTRFWPNFKGRFLGPTLTDVIIALIFVQATLVLASFVRISLLLVTDCWPNFKGRFLGPCISNANWHVDICLGNLCPGRVSQKYKSCMNNFTN